MSALPGALSQAHQSFDSANRHLSDDKHRQAVQRVVQAVLRTAGALRNN